MLDSKSISEKGLMDMKGSWLEIIGVKEEVLGRDGIALSKIPVLETDVSFVSMEFINQREKEVNKKKKRDGTCSSETEWISRKDVRWGSKKYNFSHLMVLGEEGMSCQKGKN